MFYTANDFDFGTLQIGTHDRRTTGQRHNTLTDQPLQRQGAAAGYIDGSVRAHIASPSGIRDLRQSHRPWFISLKLLLKCKSKWSVQ